jgi:hypothetical protein
MIMNEYFPAADANKEKGPTDGTASLADELKAIPFEPLLPIEKKLIAGSLLLGVSLLGLLYWLGATYFPVARP